MPSIDNSNQNLIVNVSNTSGISPEVQNGNQNENQIEDKSLKEAVSSTTSEDSLVSLEVEDDDTSKTQSTSTENSALDGLYMQQQTEIKRMEQIQKRIAKRTKDLSNLKKRLSLNPNMSDKSKSSLQTNIGKVESDISSLNSELSKCQSNLSNIVNSIQNVNTTSGITSVGTVQNGTVTGSVGTTATSQIPADLAQRLDTKLGTGFAAKCEEISAKLNCNPNDLLAMMFSESGIDPHCVGYNGAVGLCMFMPSVLAGKGYNSSQVAAMSGVEQLDLVYEFLHESKTSFVGLSDSDVLDAGTLYAMNFLPAYAKNEVLCSAGSGYYSANSPLDLDGDGNISKTDLAKRLSNKFDELYKYF